MTEIKEIQRENQSRQSEERFNHSAALACGAFLSILLWAACVAYRTGAPPPVGINADPQTFSSGRAMKSLSVMAQDPRPVGSPEHDRVRDYICRQLVELGLAPQVQRTTAANRNWGPPLPVATVENIITRLDGKLEGIEGRKAVLLIAHYDSMPNSPGASDDASGVATLLETARALKAGPPLRNDVILLFSDGEEIGLLGSKAFVEEHPWAGDVGIAFNFEARGNRGPVLMFETSNGNAGLIRALASASPRPVAASYMYDLYRTLPNDTDFSILRRAVPGFNFARIDGLTHYHTMLDTVEHTDERSLQHEGQYALALSRYFGDGDLELRKEGDAVYFDLLGLFLVQYSTKWALPLAGLTIAALVAIVDLAHRRKLVRAVGVVKGFLACGAGAVLFPVLSAVVWRFIGALQGPDHLAVPGGSYKGEFYLVGFIALGIAVTASAASWFGKRHSALHLALGACLWWTIGMLLTGILLPGSSYLFTWPLLLGLLPLALLLFQRTAASFRMLALTSVCLAAAIVLLVPALVVLFAGLGMNSIILISMLVALLASLFIPQLILAAGGGLRWLPATSAAVGLGLILFAFFTDRFDNNHPRFDSLFYGLDSDSGSAIWGSFDERSDQWTSQVLRADAARTKLVQFFPSSSLRFLTSPAPEPPLAAPDVRIIEDSAKDGVRRLHLRATSSRDVPTMSFYIDDCPILSATVNGKRIDYAGKPIPWAVRYYAMPTAGIDLILEINSLGPVVMRVVDQSFGLPKPPEVSLEDRPDDIIPEPVSNFFQNATMVSKSYNF